MQVRSLTLEVAAGKRAQKLLRKQVGRPGLQAALRHAAKCKASS
jgi:hypothetical protein